MDAAQKAIDFIECLELIEGDYAQFKLEPFQKQIVADLMGTLGKDGLRQYNTAYIEIPRKNGKTPLIAALGLYMLLADGEKGAQIYCAASDIKQASLIYRHAGGMVANNKELSKRLKVIPSQKRIVDYSTNSYMEAISAEAYTKHGLNAHAILFDELHAQPNRELWDVLSTSMGTRKQPLLISITTAGFDKNSICYEQHEYARKIKEGIIQDPHFYPVIYSADEDDDWTDEKIWHKCNPALGHFRSLKEMRQLCAKAKETPALENTFRRLYLNQWTSQETRFIPMRKWDECGQIVVPEKLKGRQCYAGLDLAQTTDIAALVLVFPPDDPDTGVYDVLPYFFIPEDSIRERSRKDHVDYELWRKQGFIKATDGEVVNYGVIREEIFKIAEKFNLREVAYDRWSATQLSQELDDEGVTVVPFGQGFASMSHPTKELLSMVLAKRINHGGNPVLRWMADNMVVKEDPAGNFKPDKSKSTEKIDGIVAMIMAIDRAIRHKDNTSVYEERGIITI